MAISREYKWVTAGVALGLVFLWLATRGVEAGQILQALSATSFPYLLGVAVAAAMFMLLKAVRWQIILRPVGVVNISTLQRVAYAGTAANLIVPHSGEVLRASIVAGRLDVPTSAVLASVGVERLLDFGAVFIMLVIVLVIESQGGGMAVTSGLVTAGLIVVALVAIGTALAALVLFPSRLRALLSGFMWKFLPPIVANLISDQVEKGRVGLVVLGSPWMISRLLLLSVLQWGFIVLTIWLSAAAIGHPQSIPMSISVWVLMVIGLTLPSSPAQLGTTQLAYALGYDLMGISGQNDVAFAASVVYTLGVNLFFLLAGFACWLMLGGARAGAVTEAVT